MKVLFVVPWYKPHVGGVVIALSKLVSNLRAGGDECVIMIHGDHDEITELDTDCEEPVFAFNFRSPQSEGHKLKAGLAFLVYLFPTLLRLNRFLKRNNIDIVNIHFPSSHHIYFLFLKILFSWKYVISLQGSDIRVNFFEGRLNKILTGILLKNANALTACSRNLLDFTEKAIGRLPNLSRVIYNGVDESWLDAGIRDSGGAEEKYILTVASLLEVKGIDILLKAFRIFCDQLTDCKLYIAGDGILRTEIEELRGKLNLDKQAVFLGVMDHDRIKELYENSIFCVMPSRSEGFPLAGVEAQASGKALIATSVGGIPELVEDGVSGCLVPSENPRELAEKMIHLYNNQAIRDNMGKNGFSRVKENFTWEINCRNFLDLFRRAQGESDKNAAE